MMNLEEAIKHAEDKSKNHEKNSCAAEHKQLADWLKDYRNIKEIEANET